MLRSTLILIVVLFATVYCAPKKDAVVTAEEKDVTAERDAVVTAEEKDVTAERDAVVTSEEKDVTAENDDISDEDSATVERDTVEYYAV